MVLHIEKQREVHDLFTYSNDHTALFARSPCHNRERAEKAIIDCLLINLLLEFMVILKDFRTQGMFLVILLAFRTSEIT